MAQTNRYACVVKLANSLAGCLDLLGGVGQKEGLASIEHPVARLTGCTQRVRQSTKSGEGGSEQDAKE